MERTYLKPGTILAHKIDPEDLFIVLKVKDCYGTTWVDVVKARYCLHLQLKEVQDKFEVVYVASDAEVINE